MTITSSYPTPLKYSSSLDHLEHFEVTPIIGREYHQNVQLRDIMKDEKMVRDLAVIISRRGVVFFRSQSISLAEQKSLAQSLGIQSGKPPEHGLYVHPLWRSPDLPLPVDVDGDGKGEVDKEVFVINNESHQKLFQDMHHRRYAKDASSGWHTDSTFDPCPADYSFLRMAQTPATGGDTLFASSYGVYDRLSPPMQSFFSTLTCTCAQPIFNISAKKGGYEIDKEPRGSPLNIGDAHTATHPVVRTNPVTGWRGVFALGLHVEKIDGLTPNEEGMMRDYILRLVVNNHDLQARMKWGKGDVAIWDNRAVYHSGTPDVKGVRTGNRASSVGERPYFDPGSKGMAEALREEEEAEGLGRS